MQCGPRLGTALQDHHAPTERSMEEASGSIWQDFQLSHGPPSPCLQLRDIWLWLDVRVLQELQLFHIICPRASSSLCQGEGGQSFGCLLYRASLTAGQKEAAESLSCLQTLQQEELRWFNESIQTKNLPQPEIQPMLIEH